MQASASSATNPTQAANVEHITSAVKQVSCWSWRFDFLASLTQPMSQTMKNQEQAMQVAQMAFSQNQLAKAYAQWSSFRLAQQVHQLCSVSLFIESCLNSHLNDAVQQEPTTSAQVPVSRAMAKAGTSSTEEQQPCQHEWQEQQNRKVQRPPKQHLARMQQPEVAVRAPLKQMNNKHSSAPHNCQSLPVPNSRGATAMKAQPQVKLWPLPALSAQQ